MRADKHVKGAELTTQFIDEQMNYATVRCNIPSITCFFGCLVLVNAQLYIKKQIITEERNKLKHSLAASKVNERGKQ